MKYTFTGKNVAVSERMRERTMTKIDRLSRLFPENAEVLVTFSAARYGNKIEVTIPMRNRRILRAETISADMFAAIDEAVEILDRQLTRHKSRLKDKSRRDKAALAELQMYVLPDEPQIEVEEFDAINIEKRKHFPLKPMDPEEAAMAMDLLGHSFYVFRNSSTNDINVIYKRKSGNYGLIDPNDPADPSEDE